MAERHRRAVLISIVLAAALAAPATASPVAAAGGLVAGLVGPGLGAIAAGDLPGRSMVTRERAGWLEVGVAVELAATNVEAPGGRPQSAIRGRLEAAGLDIRGSWQRSVEGYVRPRDLKRLAATPGVVAVRAIRRPLVTAFVGPGPAVHGATPWHEAGYSGAGIRVGVLDGGFDGLTTRLGSEAPATVAALCFREIGVPSTSLADCEDPGNTHGTAVVESIVDMAPGAALYVSNAFSQADKAAAIAWMTTNGVRIVNYSQVGSLMLQGMGDGTSEYDDSDYALVDAAVKGGALFVAAAGNSGQGAWQGPATDADGDGWVEFSGPDEANEIALQAGELIAVALRWASPASDYDLLLFDGETAVASSEDYQVVTDDAIEFFTFEAPREGTFDLGIRHDGGPAAPLLRVFMQAPGAATLAHYVTAGSLAAPADSRNPGMVTVGAVDHRSPATIEPYSSQGPTLDGRVKPDLVAADCAPTTVEAIFCGTSQAAPFVSGAAALLLEADPSLSPTALATLLRQRAVPLGSPVPNSVYGAGRLDVGPSPIGAPAAASFVAPPASGTAAGPLLGQPTVGVVDGSGRVTDRGPGATMEVTLRLDANPTGATLTCEGGTTKAAAGGIAAFSGCSIDLAGAGYTVRADVPGLTSATSAPFAVGAPGDPPQLSLAVTPTTVVYGKGVSGTVSTGVPGGANATAIVERTTDGRTWQPVQDVQLDPLGAGTHGSVPVVHGTYRARLALADGSVAVSASVQVRVNATATLASSVPSGRTVTRTTRITLTETIRPAGPGVARGRARFDVLQQVGTTWVRRRTIYASADVATGRARTTLTLPAGRWWIRSRAEPTATNGASAWTTGVRYRVP